MLEEDKEIGEPEKCDGLVSLQELRRYAMPEKSCVQSRVTKGVVFSPSGRKASLDASRLDVVVIDRSAFDKQLAGNAEAWGAEVRLGTRVTGVEERPDGVKVSAGSEVYAGSYYVDATGPTGVMKFNREGLVPTAKYEVEGDWFTDGVVEVYTDQEKYPGFFAWVIPRGPGIAKVGAAGFGINAAKALEAFLAERDSKIVSKVACTIYVGGPIEQFVSGRTVYVGESAGQVKPTTAGGIPSSVAGGVIAARWVSDSVMLKDPSLVSRYQPDWSGRYGKEYRLMTRLRHIYENLSNRRPRQARRHPRAAEGRGQARVGLLRLPRQRGALRPGRQGAPAARRGPRLLGGEAGRLFPRAPIGLQGELTAGPAHFGRYNS